MNLPFAVVSVCSVCSVCAGRATKTHTHRASRSHPPFTRSRTQLVHSPFHLLCCTTSLFSLHHTHAHSPPFRQPEIIHALAFELTYAIAAVGAMQERDQQRELTIVRTRVCAVCVDQLMPCAHVQTKMGMGLIRKLELLTTWNEVRSRGKQCRSLTSPADSQFHAAYLGLVLAQVRFG